MTGRLGPAVLVLAAAFFAGRAEARTAPAPSAPPDSLVCGPRSARLVLGHFGIESDLIELIRELQWPSLSRGTRLSSLKAALERRGLHAVAVRCEGDRSVWYPGPVIYFAEPLGPGIGHFHADLPASGDERAAFAPPVPAEFGPASVALVIGRGPVDLSRALVRRSRRRQAVRFACASLCIAVLLVAAAPRRFVSGPTAPIESS